MSNFPEKADDYLTRADDIEDGLMAKALVATVHRLVLLSKGEELDPSRDTNVGMIAVRSQSSASGPGRSGTIQSLNGAGAVTRVHVHSNLTVLLAVVLCRRCRCSGPGDGAGGHWHGHVRRVCFA